MPDLCTTFRREAGVVWNRMRTAALLGLSLSEETLTESSLYNIAVSHQGTDIVIDLATKPAEKKHGADWEWWLVHGKKGIGFRVQAKRLFADGRYQSLTKTTGNRYWQLDTLVVAARKAEVQPLYCFYNFSHPQSRFNGPNSCNHSYRAPSFWGCSITFPDQVKEVQSNHLSKLQPTMHPWHTLVCGSAQIGLLAAAIQFVKDCGRPDTAPGPRNLPNRVRQLIELGHRRRRQADKHRYLDDAYWDSDVDVPKDVSGLIVIQDLGD